MSLDSLNINLDDVQETSGGSTPFPPGEYTLSAALYERKTWLALLTQAVRSGIGLYSITKWPWGA